MDDHSIGRADLESLITEQNSPDPVLESYFRQQLQQRYADPSQALAASGGTEIDTAHGAISEQPQSDKGEVYDFPLFARPSASGPASVGLNNGPQRITLRSPSPARDSLGLISGGRPDEYYFAGDTGPELTEQYTQAAVSGQDIIEGLSMRWVCCLC